MCACDVALLEIHGKNLLMVNTVAFEVLLPAQLVATILTVCGVL